MLAIWEGTTNILSLDVLRALAKSKGAVLQNFALDVSSRLEAASSNAQLSSPSAKVRKAVEEVLGFAARNTSQLEVAARDFSYSIARIAVGKLTICYTSLSNLLLFVLMLSGMLPYSCFMIIVIFTHKIHQTYACTLNLPLCVCACVSQRGQMC